MTPKTSLLERLSSGTICSLPNSNLQFSSTDVQIEVCSVIIGSKSIFVPRINHWGNSATFPDQDGKFGVGLFHGDVKFLHKFPNSLTDGRLLAQVKSQFLQMRSELQSHFMQNS